MVRSYEGQRHIQSALDLDLIDCGESISCKSENDVYRGKCLSTDASGSMFMFAGLGLLL